MDNSKKKFSIGLNGQQCIGPCYPPDSKILHPITLEMKSIIDEPFCPTMGWMDKRDNREKWTDACLIADNEKDIDYGKVDISYVLPTLGINCEIFLKLYYDVYSFEGAVDIITNDRMPFNTHLRLLNCAWKVYGSNIDVINDQLINFYVNIIKREWIKEIYPYVAKYIYVDNKNIFLKENDSDIQSNQIEKINYFNKKFNNQQIIYKVISSYINANTANWSNIIDHNKNIKYYYIDYVVDKIKNTINNEI